MDLGAIFDFATGAVLYLMAHVKNDVSPGTAAEGQVFVARDVLVF